MSTRQRILDEATDQVVERGYAAFTVASVRDALGLSSGSMFHAFPSKPALVAAVYVAGMRTYHATAIEALASTPDPAGAIEAWVEAHLLWVGEHRALARFLFATQPDDVLEAAAPALTEANTAFFLAVEDVFERAAKAGVMARLPAGLGHSVVMGAVQEYCRQWTRGAVTVHPRDVVAIHQRVALAALSAAFHQERSHA